MTNSCTRPVSVGYSDHRVSDWGVREAGWPVCGHGAPVGTGRPYPGPPRTHRAAVLRRVGHQESSSARIRRTFPHDGRVVPGVLSWAEGRSRGTGLGDGAVLSRAWSERGRVRLTEIGGGMDLTRRTFVAVMDAIQSAAR